MAPPRTKISNYNVRLNYFDSSTSHEKSTKNASKSFFPFEESDKAISIIHAFVTQIIRDNYAPIDFIVTARIKCEKHEEYFDDPTNKMEEKNKQGRRDRYNKRLAKHGITREDNIRLHEELGLISEHGKRILIAKASKYRQDKPGKPEKNYLFHIIKVDTGEIAARTCTLHSARQSCSRLRGKYGYEKFIIRDLEAGKNLDE